MPRLGGVIPLVQEASEVERATNALIAEAGRQINLQYQSSDAQDVKTFGMIASAIAGAAFVASTAHQWRSLFGIPIWTVPLILLVVGVGLLFISVWHRTFRRGPRVPELYRTFNGTMMEAKGQLLRELVEAIEHNHELLKPKGRWYKAGCWVLFLAVISTALAIIASIV
jgi:hypothetical protein